MEMSILQIWPLCMTRTHTSGCTQALALDPEAVAEDRFDSGDICRISVQDASLKGGQGPILHMDGDQNTH